MPIASEIIWAIAAKIPPKACPPTVAVIYFGENLPIMPKRDPDNIALATNHKNRIKSIKIAFFDNNYHLVKRPKQVSP